MTLRYHHRPQRGVALKLNISTQTCRRRSQGLMASRGVVSCIFSFISFFSKHHSTRIYVGDSSSILNCEIYTCTEYVVTASPSPFDGALSGDYHNLFSGGSRNLPSPGDLKTTHRTINPLAKLALKRALTG